MYKAVIYARYSSDKQTEQSIEGQIRYCTDYAKRCGYKIVGSYIDRAASGTSDRRPQFQNMIEDSKKKQFQYIIVWKLDRFSRNRYDSAIYKTKLKKCGVKVISATESLGEGDEAILLEAMLEAMAEVYSRQISQNASRGMRESAIKGQTTGGNIPLGYKIENKYLVVDERKADIVRFIFNEYASGKSQTEICKECNEKGYVTKNGKQFYTNALSSILKNKMYIGDYNFKGEIERNCPVIVDKETFNKCQERLERNKRIRGQKKTEEVEFLLTGKLFCGMCGTTMVGDSGTSRNGSKHYYYTCRNKRKHQGCKKLSEKKDFIEWYVVEQTVNYVLTDERRKYIAERIVGQYNKDFSKEKINRLKKKLVTIDIELNNCAEALIKSKSTSIIEKINNKAEQLEIQKEDTEIELAELQIATDIQITYDEVYEWLERFCKGDLFDIEFRKRIIDVFINSIFLYDDKVIIYYNIKGSKQISYIEMLEETEHIDVSNMNGSDSFMNGEPNRVVYTTLFFYAHLVSYQGDYYNYRLLSAFD